MSRREGEPKTVRSGRIRRNLKPRKPSAPDRDFEPIEADDLPADIVLTRLREAGLRVQGSGTWQAICPVHADLNPSLSLTETTDGVLLLHCHAGCDPEEILDALDLTPRDLFPTFYAQQFSKRQPQGTQPFYGASEGSERIEPPEPTAEECAKWKRLLKNWRASDAALRPLAKQLHLDTDSLQALQVGYDRARRCWVFPEQDDRGRIVGLVRRYSDGSKRAIKGSVRGLTLPRYEYGLPEGPLYVAEGATDTAALHSKGELVVGRSSARGSAAQRRWLITLLKAKFQDRHIIVLGDRDTNQVGICEAGGLASRLRSSLGRSVTCALPARGFKDIRDQIVAKRWYRGIDVQENPTFTIS
jgi:hypothetical protein